MKKDKKSTRSPTISKTLGLQLNILQCNVLILCRKQDTIMTSKPTFNPAAALSAESTLLKQIAHDSIPGKRHSSFFSVSPCISRGFSLALKRDIQRIIPS